ncbi:MAG: Stp1/IreP family PP2C-type Ser/Thr phosphatase [bacterium]
MGLRIKVGAVTDTGRTRDINEDHYIIAKDMGLFLVADGLGGHNAGEVASRMAGNVIKDHLNAADDTLVGEYEKEFSRNTNRMLSGIRLANTAIYEAGQHQSEHRGMGTTISSVLINRDVMALAHVGDSRIYRIRKRRIKRLTRDHTMVEEQVQRGLITKEEAEHSGHKNIITRALGIGSTIEIDADEDVLHDHDRILLCTDGLTNMVSEGEILDIVLGYGDDPQRACRELVNKANGNGGRDNITVILLHYNKDAEKGRGLGRAILSRIGAAKQWCRRGTGAVHEGKGERSWRR